MSFPSEKSPEAMATLFGTNSVIGGPEQRPPPYEPTPNPFTSPSTTSLASLEDVSHLKSSTSTKFFISQKGNTLRPWPWCYSSELVTPIFDSTRTFPLYTSTRFKKNSGSCIMSPVYSAEHQEPADSKSRFEVHTTYFFGPGNDPVISCDFGGDRKVETIVRSKGKLTRSRWFEWNGDRYEWRYVGQRNASGMVLQRVVTDAPAIPDIVITDEKRPGAHVCPHDHGKGKAKKTEDEYVTVADFQRDEEEGKKCLGFSPAGQGGWVTIYEKEEEGRRGLPEWLVLASCMVMLKRERDRRTIQIAMMSGGGGGS
ncbi:hypothetical protein L211DRAFT_867451 [Terfezia boudieri ATCC MYA-4762]|uniref:Uncharacterized protein n=1 Tax=Terfezia boudieri ATCC MYA-4762 TaxID=1051890 RepID=A0A3N4LTI0_9PEZI|nr:hypothetical protein L211DRAFT_867451 [Terfezia boudieri ATCC MYA-4762]